MKVLYIGGQKSGKSALAQQEALDHTQNTPVYVATYANNFKDKEMEKRILEHKLDRQGKFKSIEESFNILKYCKHEEIYVVDCIGMIVLNMMEKKFTDAEILEHIEAIAKSDYDFVFVLNDVNSGIIPPDSYSRRYADLCGLSGQILARECEHVYLVSCGLKLSLK